MNSVTVEVPFLVEKIPTTPPEWYAYSIGFDVVGKSSRTRNGAIASLKKAVKKREALLRSIYEKRDESGAAMVETAGARKET